MKGLLAQSWWKAGTEQKIALPVWPIGLFSMWDVYFAGIRPLDQLGLAMLGLCLLYQRRFTVNSGNMVKLLAVSFAFLCLLVLGGLQNADALKPAIGLIECLIAALLVATSQWKVDDTRKLLKTLIIIHVAALYFQYAIFLIFHYQLNYQAFLGTQLRTDNGMGMRPAGLMLEPSGYGLIMFSLLSLFRLIGGRAGRLEALAGFSVILSLSLWGWASMLVYLLLFRRKFALALVPIAFGAGAYFASTLAGSKMNDSLLAWIIFRRILNPGGEDGSTQARYGGLSSFSIGSPEAWFGQGISNDYQAFGANGLSFILSAGGIVGLLIVTGLWFLMLPRGRRLAGTICLTFMLSAASQWTFIWWWIWIALAVCVDSSDPQQQPVRGISGDLDRHVYA